MTLQRLTRISLLAALCVALRQAFAPFPNVQPISAIFFLLVFDAHLAHQLQVVALCPSDPFCGPTVLCLWGLDR